MPTDSPKQKTIVRRTSEEKPPRAVKFKKSKIEAVLADTRNKEVYLITCGKCDSDMCLWLYRPSFVNDKAELHFSRRMHRIVSPSGLLRTTTKRIDGVMGYQCWCGSDSRTFPVEERFLGHNPDGSQPSRDEYDAKAIKDKMKEEAYEPEKQDIDAKTTVWISRDGFDEDKIDGKFIETKLK